MWEREAIAKNVRWRVGSGRDIKIRQDRWLKSDKIGGEELSGEPQTVNELINTKEAKWDEQKLSNKHWPRKI